MAKAPVFPVDDDSDTGGTQQHRVPRNVDSNLHQGRSAHHKVFLPVGFYSARRDVAPNMLAAQHLGVQELAPVPDCAWAMMSPPLMKGTIARC